MHCNNHRDSLYTGLLRKLGYPDDIWTVRIWTVKIGLGLECESGLGLGLGLGLVMTVQILTVQILTGKLNRKLV